MCLSYFDGNRTVTCCKVIERLHFAMCPNGYILLTNEGGTFKDKRAMKLMGGLRVAEVELMNIEEQARTSPGASR